MKKTMLLAGAAMIGVGLLTAHANAQGVPQTVEITKVDVQKVAAVYRASKVIGSSVLNDSNETIGKIDDLLGDTRRQGAIRRSVNWWLPGHGHPHGGRPLRQPQVRRQQDCAAGRDKGRA